MTKKGGFWVVESMFSIFMIVLVLLVYNYIIPRLIYGKVLYPINRLYKGKNYMKKFRFVYVIVLLCLGLALLTACGGPKGPTEVKATLTEFTIELDKSTIPAGAVRFVITNNGAIPHEFVLEAAGAMDAPFEKDGKESEAEAIEPGTTSTLEWTLAPGDYHIGCYIEGHFEAGMEASFTVTE